MDAPAPDQRELLRR